MTHTQHTQCMTNYLQSIQISNDVTKERSISISTPEGFVWAIHALPLPYDYCRSNTKLCHNHSNTSTRQSIRLAPVIPNTNDYSSLIHSLSQKNESGLDQNIFVVTNINTTNPPTVMVQPRMLCWRSGKVESKLYAL